MQGRTPGLVEQIPQSLKPLLDIRMCESQTFLKDALFQRLENNRLRRSPADKYEESTAYV